MRARTLIVLSFVVALAGMPAFACAATPDPFIHGVSFLGMTPISIVPSVLQTALRPGDALMLRVFVHSLTDVPEATADFSAFGYSSNATTSGKWVGYDVQYYPSYFYDFDPLTISASTPDGTYTIPITATKTNGDSATASASIVVDTKPPTLKISDVSFSTTSPNTGDTMYLSGVGDGTGSAFWLYDMYEIPEDESGTPLSQYGIGIDGGQTLALQNVIAASSDGSFSRQPFTLFDMHTGQLARATQMKIGFKFYDGAGNIATSSTVVPIPKTPPPDPCVAAGNCVSNVLFLPGIEGSRLYEGTGCGKSAEEKLWEPVDSSWSGTWNTVWGAGDGKVHDLSLNPDGSSTCPDIYTKEGDVIDKTAGGNLYASLINEMNGLKADKTIKDWEPVSYDWRLSLDDLLAKGTERDGKIYYEEATSTPYIEQTLRALAASSKTGKVTIIAHSNGGLVAKALLAKLGDTEAAKLVDKMIMVAVPQSGAPADVGSLLVGYGAGLYADVSALKGAITIVSNAAARAFSQNSPMAYHLLPSASYLASVIDEPTHPVVHFMGDGYAKERQAYGNSIVDLPTLDDFLLAKNSEREKPTASDLLSPEILNSLLIDYANREHAVLDAWAPPAGVEVDQIAGWGVDTVAGVDFYTNPPPTGVASAFEPIRDYRPIVVEDGDGTVPVPSALMMATSTNSNVKRYWVDLNSIYKDTKIKRSHADLFEISSLQDFIKNILENSTSTLPAYISSAQPAAQDVIKKLTFYLHSPLTLQLTDASGNVTGLGTDDSITENIPGSTYGQFGEVKYVTVPEGGNYNLTMHGQASGTFSLDLQESLGGVIITTSTLASVPVTPSTLASLTISGGIDTASPLSVDESGDGKDAITITPKSGETVNYTPPAPAPEVPAQVGGAGAGGAGPVYVEETPAIVATTIISTSSEQTVVATTVTITPPLATSTPVVAVATKLLQVEKKNPVFIAAIPGAHESKKIQVAAEKINQTIPQTASVYDAVSQQSLLNKLGEAVYNELHGLWSALKKFF